jgi:hypothetical protein
MNAKTQNEKALDTRDLVEAWARERLLTGGSKPAVSAQISTG